MAKQKKLKIGILKHKEVGYAEEILTEVLRNRGHVVSTVNPTKVVFDLENNFPDVVVARCELNSFSEDVFTAYLIYLEECRKRSIPVINCTDFLLAGQNKYLSHLTLRKYSENKKIKDTLNPRTYLTFDVKQAMVIGAEEIQKFGSVVIKHPASGRGDGVYLCSNLKGLKKIVVEKFKKEEPILLQQTIDKEKGVNGGYRDIRVWVCRNAQTNKPEVVSAYYRNAPEGQFLTNQSRGAFIYKMPSIDKELIRNSKLVLEATGGDVTGMDFAIDAKGHYWFEEVNIAFETLKSQVDLVGDTIWHRVADLVESRYKIKTKKAQG